MNFLKSILKHLKKFIFQHKLLSLAVVVGITIVLILVFSKKTSAEFEFVEVERKNLFTSVEGSGSVSTESQVTLRSSVAGQITEVLVSSGDEVKKGQILVRLDGTKAYQNLQRAQIALERQQSLMAEKERKTNSSFSTGQDSLENAYDEGKIILMSSATSLSDILSSIESLFSCNGGFVTTCQGYTSRDLEAQYKRTAEDQWWKAYNMFEDVFQDKYTLLTQNSSQADIDETLSLAKETASVLVDAAKLAQDAVVYSRDRVDWNNTYQVNKADEAYALVVQQISAANQVMKSINNAQDTITKAQRSLNDVGQDLEDISSGSNLLDLRDRQLAVREAQTELAKYSIRAPFAGTIGAINAIQYDWIGNNTAIGVLSTETYSAQIALNEVDITQVEIGQKVELSFDALQDVTLSGVVSEIDPIGSESSNVVSFKVKIIFEELDERIRSGMNVTANIIISERENVLTVPNGAIKSEGDLSYVEVENTETGINDRVYITLGESNDTESEVLSGLVGGEKVMVRQIEKNKTAAGSRGFGFGN